MIQKKVISQTIPTFYSDKNDFENSCENFSILTTSNKQVPIQQANNSNSNKIASTKMEPSIKSVNYFGYQFNTNKNKAAAAAPASTTTTNTDNAQLNNSKSSLQDKKSPSQLFHRKSQQSSFQKYVIENQVRQHFYNRNSQKQTESDSNTKYMISKILNGDLDSSTLSDRNKLVIMINLF
jgi:hypothetical protein